jgi:hypothetical protein
MSKNAFRTVMNVALRTAYVSVTNRKTPEVTKKKVHTKSMYTRLIRQNRTTLKPNYRLI